MEQPNILISQNAYQKSIQMSLFDLKVILDQTENELLFDTKPGELDSLGISQPLIKVKFTESQSIDLDVQLKRPAKLCLTHTIAQKALKLIAKVQDLVTVEKSNITKKQMVAININKKIIAIKSNLKGIDNFNLVSNQLVIDLKAADMYDFNIFCSGVKSKLKVFERPEKIEFSTEVSCLSIKHKNKIALHPFYLNLKTSVLQPYWKKDMLAHINISSNYLRFDLNASLVNQVSIMQQEFMKVWSLTNRDRDEHLKKTPLRVNPEVLIPLSIENINFDKVSGASIEHYQDDLR